MDIKGTCFVLMPFGRKQDTTGNLIDFDLIYTSLIAPAIQRVGIEPVRWDDVSAAGSIGSLIFERLQESDIVVADVSAASPNVFYELGIRHALRPSITVLVASQNARIPNDLAGMRIARYRLNESGRPDDSEEFFKVFIGLLSMAASGLNDSPVYQMLNLKPPERLRRFEAQSSAFPSAGLSGLEWKRKISEAKYGGVEELRALEAGMTGVSLEVLLEMFKAYYTVGAWKELLSLAEKFPPALAASPTIQEQRAIALNRTGESDRAEALLHDLLLRNGPSSETFGILGRVYKDRWQMAAQAGDVGASRFLDQAIESYVKGFEEDWRDFYPGINAITLMDVRETPDPRRDEMIPVVRYAVKRRLAKPKADYWDLATLLELEVLANATSSAKDILARISSTHPAAWQTETTARNLKLIREARQRKGLDSSWILEVEAQLARAPSEPHAAA